ncbi:hypothetical protein BKA70DRAFT_1296810 [Coprinopsis sp. MPI-PUGE-AT-0042]|nr:hypothetical protein BKA70DRAFT_1296810 [Coprinopsis sp. MPI-PUGE-AT-0042]
MRHSPDLQISSNLSQEHGEKAKQWVTGLFESLDALDPEWVPKYFEDNAVMQICGVGTINGATSIRQYMDWIFKGTKKSDFLIKSMHLAGNQIIVVTEGDYDLAHEDGKSMDLSIVLIVEKHPESTLKLTTWKSYGHIRPTIDGISEIAGEIPGFVLLA